jgi:squalene synthase HpnC
MERGNLTSSDSATTDAYRVCQEIARKHYENFPVASVLIPAHLRKHIAAIYAFARTADDFADEERDRKKLQDWRDKLWLSIREPSDHPVFIALADTIRTFEIPVQWLDDLLQAFLLDLDKNRFSSLQSLEKYCRYSAHPVGRLVLWIFGYRSEKVMLYSDRITSALQLTNFWQDISVDLKKDKIYIPTDFLEKFSISEREILEQKSTDNFSAMMEILISETEQMYLEGLQILHSVEGRLKRELQFTIAGGQKILEKTRNNRNRLLTYRPKLNKFDWLKISVNIILNQIKP